MPPEAPTESFDPRTWAMFIACGSLLFSLFNFFWTNKIRKEAEAREKDIRSATVLREQFCENIQRPINRILEDLEVLGERLNAIASAGHIANVNDVADINRDFAQSHSRLGVKLRKADESQFANGTNWYDLTVDRYESALTKLNVAYNTTLTDKEKCESLVQVEQDINQICSLVRTRLEDEISNQLR